jgi:thiamine-phosphate pyrophosphorylase
MDLRQKKHARKAYPGIWLMTDPRLDAGLLAVVQRLPFGSGVILRHYHLEPTKRRALFLCLRRICRRRGHLLFVAGEERIAIRWHADGFHNRTAPRGISRKILRSAPVHNAREIAVARRNNAQILLLSPVYATKSHKGARPLGPCAFNRLAKLGQGRMLIALGGMNASKAAMFNKALAYGWAGIEAFQKRTSQKRTSTR